jgi:hypothetical protein
MTTADVDDTTTIETSHVSDFRRNELVLGTTYERLVMGKLQAWGAGPEITPDDRDPRLGLARATLNPGPAVDYLTEHHADWVEGAKQAATSEGYASGPLDVLLRCLRRAFADDYGGWVPTVAKNRMLHGVRGSYVIDGGAGSGPTPPQPYVIDGGGSSDPTLLARGRVVGRRAAQPGAGVRVGVVDTKLFPHPWLTGAFVADSEDLWPPDSWTDLPDAAYHATFVTGLILSQAPGATVEVQAALDQHAQRDSWDVAKTIATFADGSLDVLNLSLGCATDDDRPPLVLTRALATLDPGTVVVAAAGNFDPSGPQPVRPMWPAALDSVLAVGAVAAEDNGYRRADFSPDVPWVDVLAPGVGVVSTWGVQNGGVPTFARSNGTSFAAAVVSGAIAAQMRPGVDAVQAWDTVSRAGSPAECHGRPVPIVPLATEVAGWPAPRDDTGG